MTPLGLDLPHLFRIPGAERYRKDPTRVRLRTACHTSGRARGEKARVQLEIEAARRDFLRAAVLG